MFPIKWNKAYRNKNGSISTIGAEIEEGGGGGYTLPTATSDTKGGIKIGNRLTMNGEVLSADAQVPSYTSSDSGKVLTVNASGELEWDTSGSGGGSVYDDLIIPIFKLWENGDYDIGTTQKPLNTGSAPTYTFTTSHDYKVSDIYLPNEYLINELYGVIDAKDITNFGLTLLAEEIANTVSSFTLNDSLDNYSAIFIQGCYNDTGVSTYDTTIVYVNPTINTAYWFGMKDRNSSYGGTITFTDNTHGSVSASRRFKIYGIPKN